MSYRQLLSKQFSDNRHPLLLQRLPSTGMSSLAEATVRPRDDETTWHIFQVSSG